MPRFANVLEQIFEVLTGTFPTIMLSGRMDLTP